MMENYALLASGGGGFWERFVTWYQNSLLCEILTYFRERYFSLEFTSYENFSITSQSATLIRQLILAFAIGMTAASMMAVYNRLNVGRLIRRLGKAESYSPENAKTLTDLDLFRSSMIRWELSHGTIVRKLVRCVEEEAFQANESLQDGKKRAKYRIDFTKDHFYIPEDLRYRAAVRYDRKGFGWPLVIGTGIFMLILVGLVFWLLPDILLLADRIVTAMSPG